MNIIQHLQCRGPIIRRAVQQWIRHAVGRGWGRVTDIDPQGVAWFPADASDLAKRFLEEGWLIKGEFDPDPSRKAFMGLTEAYRSNCKARLYPLEGYVFTPTDLAQTLVQADSATWVASGEVVSK